MPNRKRPILLPLFLLTTILIITATSCNMFNEPEGGNGGSLTLTVEDASCTEAWIKLNETNVELPASVKLYANDSLKQTLELTTADTLIYDEGLLPNRAYAYRAELIKPQKPTVKSQTVTAATLDTTSHNFTWETFTFGGANGSSDLRDVAIINENDIWAVGEIHTSWTDQWDSNGVWVQPYNAVHWNGQEWELKRIIVNFRGNEVLIPLEGIFAFSSTDIWLVGSLPIHGDGVNWQIYDVREITNSNLSLSNAWGSSSDNMYFVGRGGSIAHYDRSGWEKIESGTELPFGTIYGDYNEEKGEYEIIVNAFTPMSEPNRVIKYYHLNNGRLTEIDPDYQFPPSGHSWFISGRRYYFAGSRTLTAANAPKDWEEINFSPPFYSDACGTNFNDVFLVGNYGRVVHYNGVTWKDYGCPVSFNGWYGKCQAKGNIMVAVGLDSYLARLIIGRR